MRWGTGVRRLSDDAYQVRLSTREHQLLTSLPEQLEAVLSGSGGPEELRARLFPRTYEDPIAELEHGDDTDDDLRAERLAAVETFAATLQTGTVGRLGWSVELTGAEAEAWLSAINDARLALGVVLGITTESQWEEGPDPDDQGSVALWYLGWLQEQLVRALASSLPPDES